MKRLVNPTICTGSETCVPPKAHCRECSHAIYEGRAIVNGRLYRWEYNPGPCHGPLFSRTPTAECDWVPNQRHPVWNAFDRWHDKKFGKHTPNKPLDTIGKETTMTTPTTPARVEGTLDPLLACIPTNWLDPMLTGPQRVIGDPPYDCRDIERVLLAVRYRIEAHLKALARKDQHYAAQLQRLDTGSKRA